MDFRNTYEQWCKDSYFDEDTKKELAGMSDAEIQDRFYRDLEFGTGGLRGEIGAGTNRINIYTVRKASQGLANYLVKNGGQQKGVAIAYDSRRMSPEFAKEAALCFCANRIQTYLFVSLRPTPELSFALRELGCMAGVVVTASHNPPEYNGYKVYWEDGAQITAPKDKEIIAEVQAVQSFDSVKTMSEKDASQAGLLHMIGEKIDARYNEELKKLVLDPGSIKEQADKLRIVYTPLHGTGNLPVRRALREIGFEHVFVVPEQEKPDPAFSTVDYPNPEDPAVFKLGLELAKKVGADLIIATDPDADRLGVYALDGKYEAFSGNMSGALLCEYELAMRKKLGRLPANGAVVTTIVSGNMAKAIAKEYGVTLVETLTGFKFIGEQIKLFEQDGSHTYLFGYEESYGCLIGTHARDKDAVVAAVALCEAAAHYKQMGMTLWDQMRVLYERYGYYKEGLYTLTLKGKEGIEQINQFMETIRNNPPSEIGNYKVLVFSDYEKDVKKDLQSGKESSTGLPQSNVLYFELEEDAWCCIRPSGTEPKIKIYVGIKGTSLADASEKLERLLKAAETFLNR